MKHTWKLIDTNKALVLPSGVAIPLPREAVDMIAFETIAVVLLRYIPDDSSEDACRNVIAYDESGVMVWQIKPAPLSRNENPYTEIAKQDENTVLLGNWVGFTLYVNPTNGEILLKEETR